MQKSIIRFVTAGALCLLTAGMAHAQSSAGAFDGRKFFEELSARGVNTTSLDPDKFFAELSARAVKSNAPIDPKKFFEELAARGVNTQGFDPNKFFEELSARGVKMPEMMMVKSAK